jgi:hypothetical protein
MTWTRAALYWAVFLALAAYYVAAVREPPGPAASHAREAFLDFPAEQIDGLELRRGSSVVRCRRSDGRWRVTEPADRLVPSDLVGALVASLTETPDVEVVAEDSAALGAFGLQEPVSELTLQGAGRSPLHVRLGRLNPAGTAVYAQRNDSPRVFLIGLNVRYYEDLVFEALGQKRP